MKARYKLISPLIAVISALAMAPLSAGELNTALNTSALICPRPASSAFSLASAVDRALCANPVTRLWWGNVHYETAQIGIQEAAKFPQLEAQLSRARVETAGIRNTQDTNRLSLSWLLFDAGGADSAIEAAKARFDQALASQDGAVQQLIYDTAVAYLNLQATQSALLAALENERAAAESLAAATRRYELGVATPADRLQAATAHAQAKLTVIRARGNVRVSEAGLANLLALPGKLQFELAERSVTVDSKTEANQIETWLEQAQASHPALRAARASLAAATADVGVARAFAAPRVTLGLTPAWQRIGGQEVHSNTLGLTLSVPLFTGFEARHRVDAARAREAIAGAQLAQQTDGVALAVWQRFEQWRTAQVAYAASGELLDSAEEAARVAGGRYRAGVGSVIEWLNALAALADARLQRVRAGSDRDVSRVGLALAVGQLEQGSLWLPGEGR